MGEAASQEESVGELAGDVMGARDDLRHRRAKRCRGSINGTSQPHQNTGLADARQTVDLFWRNKVTKPLVPDVA
jgi:hypothetical protein